MFRSRLLSHSQAHLKQVSNHALRDLEKLRNVSFASAIPTKNYEDFIKAHSKSAGIA